jgi:hypothetical protein
MFSLNITPDPILEKILRAITLLRFNEHDFKHRKGCFKKSDECRFSYPRPINEEYGLQINFESDPTIWYASFGNNKNYACHPFTMVPRRHVADLFLNTNNPVVSRIFGFNNNVNMGNINCIFYVTLYTTKGTQNEEQFPFLKHCTAVAKRIRRLRENHNLLMQEIGNYIGDEEYSIEPNYSVGLGHVLSGIMAHLSSSVISAMLAWHLVVEGSRFRFYHDFSQILLSQFESWLIGEDIQFKFRRMKNNETGWIDCNTFQYIYRPEYEEKQGIFKLCVTLLTNPIGTSQHRVSAEIRPNRPEYEEFETMSV